MLIIVVSIYSACVIIGIVLGIYCSFLDNRKEGITRKKIKKLDINKPKFLFIANDEDWLIRQFNYLYLANTFTLKNAIKTEIRLDINKKYFKISNDTAIYAGYVKGKTNKKFDGDYIIKQKDCPNIVRKDV